MPKAGGPWERPEAQSHEPPPPGRHRWLIWLGLLAAVGAGIWGLTLAFPGAVSTGEDWAWVARGLAMVALVSTAILVPGRIRWAQGARHLGLWLAVVAVIAVAAAYRTELGGVANRVRAGLSSSYPVAVTAREMVVTQADGGGFLVMGAVNGQKVRFLIDTGASEIILSPADAERIGLDPRALRYDRPAETANGVGYGARFTVDELKVGSISLADVPVMVNQAPMSSSLLGMSFLSRLESFQVRGDRLYLRTPAYASSSMSQ